MTVQTRYRFWIALIVGYLVIFVGFNWALTQLSIEREISERNHSNIQSLWPYWAGFAGLWFILSVMAWLLWTTPANAIKLPRASSAILILTLAALARFSVATTTAPQLSDDLWRYVHDGHVLGIEGRNPYAASPQERQTPLPINHPHLVTIYQPTSQWIFTACARLTSALRPWIEVNSETTLRLCFSCFDLWIILLLMLKLRREQRSPWWSTLYAWHPLALSEVAGSGHQDVMGIACLLTVLTLIENYSKSVDTRRFRSCALTALASGCVFALAIGVKPLVAPLAIPIMWTLRRRGKFIGLAAVSTTVVLGALYIPFALMDGGLDRMIETFDTFVNKWAFNSSLHVVVQFAIGSKRSADQVMCLLLVMGLLVVTFKMRDLWHQTGLFLMLLLLLSSTVHPWYALWALPFVTARFNSAIWLFSLTISWSYAVLGSLPDYQLPLWVAVIEYLPVYALLGWQMAREPRA